jgi:kinesin family protein 18/19
MRKLRQMERRIAMISSWVAAFDGVCDSHEATAAPQNLQAMRKTAQGILIELESSRQHYHQKLAKTNWERAIDSALQTGLRQLKEMDTADGSDVSSLVREAELLKANAERESLLTVIEQEKSGDAAVVQVLLSAHFETIMTLNSMMEMHEDEAVEAAKRIIHKILNACSDATSHVIKPDGALSSGEAFTPSRSGTPRKRKPVNVPSVGLPEMAAPPTFVAAAFPISSPMRCSPVKASPKRRKAPMARKGVSFTPKKKSPSKRSVRWRDDTEQGVLADFEKTPQKSEITPPTASSAESVPVVSSPMPSYLPKPSSPMGSSPIPTPPEPSIDIRPKNNRFKAGFLSKRHEGSPPPPQLTHLSSSDSESSPLRDSVPDRTNRRSNLQIVENASSADITPSDSSNNSSDSEQSYWKADHPDAIRIKSAMKRVSAIGGANTSTSSVPMTRVHRRRSPTAATMTGSPPSDGLFTASHARRMVKSEKENAIQASVLSPRTAPILKNGRRITIGDGRQTSSLGGRDAMRLSGTVVGTPRGRESIVGIVGSGKNSWR